MKKLFKALFALGTVLSFASPAAAQISGFLSLDGSPDSPNFGVRAGLDYALNLSDTANAVVGLRYNVNLIGNPLPPSNARLFARVETALSDVLFLGGQLNVALADIGASNSIGLSLRPYVSYTFFTSDSVGAGITLNLDTAIVPAFTFTPFVQLDAIYVRGPLTVNFGAEADFTVVPGFSFDGAFGYLNINYALSEMLEVRAGAGFGFAGNTFGLASGVFDNDSNGLYAGLQYALNDNLKLRLTGGYASRIYVTLTGVFKL
jgi:opacity protein-like surface antigen